MGYSSGNAVVDELGTWSFVGNIIVPEWYRTLRKDTGRSYLLASNILADIVYWYRPTEIRDEETGYVRGWKKKFRGEQLQKSYEQYAEYIGQPKRSVKEAIDYLVSEGIVLREFRDIRYEGGLMHNVMFLSVVPRRLMEVTFPEEILATTGHSVLLSEPEDEETNVIEILKEKAKASEVPVNTGVEDDGTKKRTTSYRKTYDMVQKNVPSPTEKCTVSCKETYHVLQNDVPYPAEKRGTNTENTTETTTEIIGGDHIHPSNSIKVISMRDRKPDDVMDVTEETDRIVRLLKKNLEYDIMRERYTGSDRDVYETIFRVICHVVTGKGKRHYRIGELEFSHETVKNVFMKLTPEHIGIVMEGYQDTATKVTDMGAYLTAALYNAYLTGDLYWDRRVKHDLYGGGWEEKGIVNSTNGGQGNG